jgi:DNA-directed RNA polymerase specialized sigma24 family protein
MPPRPRGSITQIVIDIRGGDKAKVSPLWARYFDRLTHHAARHLPLPLRTADEDVALSAIDAFCDGLAQGKFDYVERREMLWGALVRITERKVYRRVARWKKNPVVFTDLRSDASSPGDGASLIASVEPTEEYSEVVRMELDDLIDSLPNPLWRQAARMVMEGYSAAEIAAKLDRTPSMVYVWFRSIRAIWEEKPGRENLFG